MAQRKPTEMPTHAELSREVQRIRYRARYHRVLRSTIYALIVVAAAAVLLATTYMPVLQIYGASMIPVLNEGDVVACVRSTELDRGDLVAFYFENKILVKRVIATAGDVVELDAEGNVYINGEFLQEPYLTEKAFGDANIEFPYRVPENRYFCLGDHRSTSVDSRHTEVGCISEEQILGKIAFRVWPLDQLGRPG